MHGYENDGAPKTGCTVIYFNIICHVVNKNGLLFVVFSVGKHYLCTDFAISGHFMYGILEHILFNYEKNSIHISSGNYDTGFLQLIRS